MKERLRVIFAYLGITLPEEATDKLARHWDMLMEANAKFNLTAITDPEEGALKHYADSLAALPLLDHYTEDKDTVWDLGTGGGFPGLALAIARPKLNFVLVDATKKKCDFLQSCVDDLGLSNVTVCQGRAEELGQDKQYREKAKLVTARALAPLPVLLEYAFPLLAVEGVLLAYKGANAQEELDQAENALAELHAEVLMNLQCPLSSGERRVILALGKTAPTPKKYPRRPGMPSKNPL